MTGESKVPVRERGRTTRAKLIDAARRVFEEDGFVDARITDISAAAGVAHGSFYTYFDSKEDVFREIADDVSREVQGSLPPEREGTAAERVRAMPRRYLECYERHAGMLGAIEQVATLEGFEGMRRDLRAPLVARVERAIDGLDGFGAAKSEPCDPYVVASVLVGMLDSFAYTWFVLGEHFEHEDALRDVEGVWLRSLGLADGARARRARRTGPRRAPSG